LNKAGEATGLPRCWVKKVITLPADLQLWDIAVEVDTIQAVEVQDDMTLEHIIDVEHLGHDHLLPGSANAGTHQPVYATYEVVSAV